MTKLMKMSQMMLMERFRKRWSCLGHVVFFIEIWITLLWFSVAFIHCNLVIFSDHKAIPSVDSGINCAGALQWLWWSVTSRCSAAWTMYKTTIRGHSFHTWPTCGCSYLLLCIAFTRTSFWSTSLGVSTCKRVYLPRLTRQSWGLCCDHL